MNQDPRSPDGQTDSGTAGPAGTAGTVDGSSPRPARQGGFHLRVLDPLTAYQLRGQEAAPQPTAYVADTLVVRGDDSRTFEALARAAHEAGFVMTPDPESERDFALLATAPITVEQRRELTRVWTRRVRLVPGPDNIDVHKPIDIWRLLQAYRALVADAPELRCEVGLEHDATAAPYTNSHPYTNSTVHEQPPLHK